MGGMDGRRGNNCTGHAAWLSSGMPEVVVIREFDFGTKMKWGLHHGDLGLYFVFSLGLAAEV